MRQMPNACALWKCGIEMYRHIVTHSQQLATAMAFRLTFLAPFSPTISRLIIRKVGYNLQVSLSSRVLG